MFEIHNLFHQGATFLLETSNIAFKTHLPLSQRLTVVSRRFIEFILAELPLEVLQQRFVLIPRRLLVLHSQ